MGDDVVVKLTPIAGAVSAGHAKYGPSSSAELMLCNGRNAMESMFPNTSSKAATDGTCTHEVAARCLKENIRAETLIGKVYSIDGYTFIVDKERAAHVQEYVDWVHARIEAYKLSGAVSVDVRIEQKIDISQWLGLDDQYGTGDVVLIVHMPDGEIIIDIVDLKYGRGVWVDAEENKQMMCYALGVIDEVGMLGDVTEVNLVIYQPRMDNIAEWKTSEGELRVFAEEYRAVVEVSEAIYASGEVRLSDLTPGEKQCNFCRAAKAGGCPALTATVVEATDADFDDLSKPLHDPQSEVRLSAMMRAVPLIEIWMKGVRAEVDRRLLSGTPVPGFKVVQGRKGSRQWVNPVEVETTLKSMRLRDDQMYDFTLISPTTAEKLSKGKDPVIGKRQWPKLQAMYAQAEGKLSVAPEDDPRPAVSVEAASDDDFDAVVQAPGSEFL